MTVAGLASAKGKDLLVHRWLAAWIDFVAVFGILVVGELLLGNALYQRTLWFWLLLALSYFPVLEGMTGRTLGRIITGTVVVDADGNVPGLRRAIFRTIPRLIEVNPFLLGGLPAGIAVLMTRYHQRIGDLWAGTYVVRRQDLLAMRAQPQPIVAQAV